MKVHFLHRTLSSSTGILACESWRCAGAACCPEYPKEISGPTVWKAEDYRNNPERWTHVFSDEEIAELSKASDDFIASGTPLTGMKRDLFPLPTLESFFGTVRKELINGKGFILFKGIPVQDWGNHKCAVSTSYTVLESDCYSWVHIINGWVLGGVYGPRILLRLFHQPEQARPRSWSCQGSW